MVQFGQRLLHGKDRPHGPGLNLFPLRFVVAQLVKSLHGRLLDGGKFTGTVANRLHGVDFCSQEFPGLQQFLVVFLVLNTLNTARNQIYPIIFVFENLGHSGFWVSGFFGAALAFDQVVRLVSNRRDITGNKEEMLPLERVLGEKASTSKILAGSSVRAAPRAIKRPQELEFPGCEHMRGQNRAVAIYSRNQIFPGSGSRIGPLQMEINGIELFFILVSPQTPLMANHHFVNVTGLTEVDHQPMRSFGIGRRDPSIGVQVGPFAIDGFFSPIIETQRRAGSEPWRPSAPRPH